MASPRQNPPFRNATIEEAVAKLAPFYRDWKKHPEKFEKAYGPDFPWGQMLFRLGTRMEDHDKIVDAVMKTANPAKFDRCVKKVQARSKGRVNAYAVCTAAGTRNPDYSQTIESLRKDPKLAARFRVFLRKAKAKLENHKAWLKSQGYGDDGSASKLASNVAYYEEVLKAAGRMPNSRSNPESSAAEMYEFRLGTRMEDHDKIVDADNPSRYSEDYGPNVTQILVQATRVVRGKIPQQVRKELMTAVKAGVLGHLKKDGLKPEVFFHPDHRNGAMERQKKEAEYSAKLIAGAVSGHNVDFNTKSNPESSAADMYESFHGAPSEEVIELVDEEHYHGNLAALGVLVELKLVTTTGYDVTLTFSDPEALIRSNPGIWDRIKKIGSTSSVYSVDKRGGRAPAMSKSTTFKGYEIFKTPSGDYRVPGIERESSFDSLPDAKKFVTQWARNPKNKGKGRKGPFQSASEVIGSAGRYLDGQLGRVLNPGTSQDLTLLTSNEHGTQLYVSGGDQSIDLSTIHMGDVPVKDSMVLGEAYFISYFTTKDFDDHQPTIYEHDLAEETDPPSPKYKKDEVHTAKNRRLCGTGTGGYPIVRYDTMNQKVYLDGGVYKIEKPWTGTSPGIED